MKKPSLTAALRRIKIVLMDIDGVLTNGLLWHFVDASGQLVELKGVGAQDSIALMWLAESGLTTGAISGRKSDGMEERLKMLKASFIYQGRLDKIVVFNEILSKTGAKASEVLFIGDDLQDLPVLKVCGVSVAVQNARSELKKTAHWTTQTRGGEGAVREVAEALLKAQGLWPKILARYV
jgi:3-deoxy-D-manno-octulosonate 8-phosphate phosphatase (KDO 8-P phosphatase)